MEEYNTRASTVESAQTPVVKKNRNIVRTILGLLLLVSLVANLWLWFMWQDAQNEQTNLRSEINSAQTTNATLRERLGEKNGQANAEANQPVNDEANIISSTKAYNATLATPLKDVKVTVTKRDGNMAIASVADATAGYKAYLKKAGDTWLVVWSGQNTPPEEVNEMFGFKASN